MQHLNINEHDKHLNIQLLNKHGKHIPKYTAPGTYIITLT